MGALTALVPWPYRVLAVVALAVALAGFGWVKGAEHVQDKWDIETAGRKAVLVVEKNRNEVTNAEIEKQHRSELDQIKSAAGRAAIGEYLRTHGLLHPAAGCVQTEGSAQPDGAAAERGAGREAEEFAARCAADALTVLDWQDWAKREGLEIDR